MFHPRPVRESDSFVSLGGDSLAFVQMSLALERKLGAVPEGWERKPAGQLARFGPQKARNWAAVDTDIVLRGLAVLFVAFHHATQGPYVGGAAALLLLAGYSLGRFQSGNLFDGQVRPVFAGLGRIVVPYFILLAFCAAMEGGVPWQKWLLLGNLGLAGYSPDGTLHVIYWFVEAYVQIVVAGALLFLLPPVRRAVAAHPLIWGLVLLAAALAARAVVRTMVDDNTLRVFATPSVLYVFAFGWCIYFARTRVQKIAVSLIAIAIFPLADPPVHNFLQVKLTVVLAACALLLWRPRLALPKPLVAPTLVVGVASYYIYLVHNLPAHFLFPHFAIPEWAGSTVNFVTGIALGLAVYGVQLTIERAKRTRRRAGGALATSAR
jgi:peptidoglycan/LPS O-acetylase OafA/YrhL